MGGGGGADKDRYCLRFFILSFSLQKVKETVLVVEANYIADYCKRLLGDFIRVRTMHRLIAFLGLSALFLSKYDRKFDPKRCVFYQFFGHTRGR